MPQRGNKLLGLPGLMLTCRPPWRHAGAAPARILEGAGPLMPARAASALPRGATRVTAWLLAFAALMLLAEMLLRPRVRIA